MARDATIQPGPAMAAFPTAGRTGIGASGLTGAGDRRLGGAVFPVTR